MQFRSKIVRGSVFHKRFGPREHSFRYPFTFFAFDLAEISHLSAESLLFARNHYSVLSLNDRDFLGREDRSILDKINDHMGPPTSNQRTLLVSSPRYFGYSFNPVNFYLRLDGDQLQQAVVEVNNTFGDTHIYPLPNLEKGTRKNTWHAHCPKDFHVSPFNDMTGEYRFTFRIEDESIFLGVDLYQNNACTMQTYLEGKSRSFTTRHLTRYALLHPLDTAFNSMPRILWQAALLFYKKKLAVYGRPRPQSPATIIDRDRPKPDRPIV